MHKWKFCRAGGLDQVMFRSGGDIAHLADLDQKLWTVLSCPVKGVRFDAKTLELLDTDRDGRIRVPEVLGAVSWLTARLVSLDPLLEKGDCLKLAALNSVSPEGAALLATARRILCNLGKESADAISLADVVDTATIFANTRFNGDGVVPAEAAEDPETRQVLGEIMATFGGEADRSGKPGVSQAKADAFFAAVDAHLDWIRRADDAVLPLGDGTADAVAALAAVRAKVDDYFTRCRLSSFDARAAGPLNRSESDFAALAGLSLSDGLAALDAFPLSRVAAGRDLPLREGVSPRWSGALERFRSAVVVPLMGPAVDSLSGEQWRALAAVFAPYEAWVAAKAGEAVAALGRARAEALAAGSARADVAALIARDVALEPENARIAEVEKLLRLKAHFASLLTNFVNMAQLYDPKGCAIFRVGTLYMDARASSLCFHVEDVGAHSAQAAASKCCLVYCQLSRPGTKETRVICAAITAGFAQSVWVGRNGVFYDLDGKDWDATIVKTVDNSISLKEAFWDPWRKIAAMMSGQVRKMLAAKQDVALAGAARKIESAAGGLSAAEPPKKMEGAALASSVAALGIAVGLISSAVGGFVGMVVGLPLWKTLLGLAAVVLLVSGPAILLTWLKLRARDLAPILNACGWAVNRSLRISLKLGQLFTAEAALPANAERQMTDPYADGHAARNRLVAALVLAALAGILWAAGLLDTALPTALKHAVPAPCAQGGSQKLPAAK